MNKRGQEQIIPENLTSEQTTLEEPKKSKTWIWIVLIIVILAIGAGFYFFRSSTISPNLPATNTSGKETIVLSSIKCDGNAYSIVLSQNYALARLDATDSNKQKVNDLKSGNNLVKEVYQLPISISETKMLAESAYNTAEGDMGSSASEYSIDQNSREFLILVASADPQSINSISDSALSLGLNWNLVYVNNQESAQTISYNCSIK